MKEIRVVTRYFKEDKEFIRDYAAIDVHVDGVLAMELDDYYHDKSDRVVYGFIRGFIFIYGESNVKIIRENVADYDEY